MPVSRPNPPTGTQPSSVSIGKKPMNYAQSTQQQQQQSATPQQQQQQPKSARAASKAPVYNQQQQQQQQSQPQQTRHPSPPTSNTSGGTKTRSAAGATASPNPGPTAAQKGKANANKIWSTSTTEERERIKDFWLGLGEQDRRNLVKIEKDTVLRKMKEQQKHSCSCAVCGRKRNAIEEELEVLYDAYYEELEQYANYQQRYVSSGGTLPPPPGPGPFPGSVELDKNGAVVAHAPVNPKRAQARGAKRQPAALPPVTNGRKQQQRTHPHPLNDPPLGKDSEFEEDEQEDEDYDGEDYEEEEDEDEDDPEEEDDEEDEDEDEDEDEVQQPQRRIATPKTTPIPRRAPQQVAPRRSVPGKGRDGLFNIGNSLTVTGPGNILTVADDLLKNDGQKFLEMMEQLAERRMQREEEAATSIGEESDEESEEGGDGSEGDDDGDDDGGGSDEDDDDEGEEEEIMTEEQKMEEGKRMFSIFAARMFEQRVHQAYREKVAQERQLQLLRELDEEDKSTRDREMKKQTQNQKKKDKKRQQKLAKEEEKAAKSAEKAAEEAAAKAKALAQEEENRKKREDERQRRETAKRAAEEERLRKEDEKKKRQQEEREREMERERKKKEKEEKLKKEREEKERKAKEEREARLAKEREERTERERIDKEKREEREKVEKEKRLAREKEEKAEKEAKEKLAAQQRAASVAQAQANTVKPPVRSNTAASSSSSSLVGPAAGKANNTSSSSSSPSLPRSPNPALNVNTNANGVPANAKKAINNKHVPSPSILPSSPGVVGQVPRPHPPQQQVPNQQANISRPPHLPPLNAMGPQPMSSHLPPPPQSGSMMYGHPQMIPSTMSPRVGNFPPLGQYPFGAPNMQQQHHPSGTPLPSGRGFNAGPPPFDPAFNCGMPIGIGVPISGGGVPPGAPSPIGPPKPKTPLASTPAPGPSMLAPGQGRRGSVLVLNTSAEVAGPGPITRPIAPIARPTTGTSGEGASSGSGSPNRRSPSPKGVLGSSALAADDDEVVGGTGPRRVVPGNPIGVVGMGMSLGVPAGQTWSPASPRTSMMTPWGLSGFSPSPRGAPNPIGSVNHLHPLHHQGVPPPIGSGSLWANNQTGSGDNWHPQNAPGAGGFFPGPPYMNHNAAASSTSHTGS